MEFVKYVFCIFICRFGVFGGVFMVVLDLYMENLFMVLRDLYVKLVFLFEELILIVFLCVF